MTKVSTADVFVSCPSWIDSRIDWRYAGDRRTRIWQWRSWPHESYDRLRWWTWLLSLWANSVCYSRTRW